MGFRRQRAVRSESDRGVLKRAMRDRQELARAWGATAKRPLDHDEVADRIDHHDGG